MRFTALLWLCAPAAGQVWSLQTSGVTASLRGVQAVSPSVVWASGTSGSWLRSADGGNTWNTGQVPGAGKLDFRALYAADASTVYLMSIGSGDQSRIYKTADAGATWKLLYTNPDPQGFFDGLAFWDAGHGIVIGDAVSGHMAVFTTEDAGQHWTRRETPPAIEGEGAFAASNTSLALRGAAEAWFATGGKGAARVFHSTDGGRSWTVATTPIRDDSASAGIFSLAFADALHGIAVGGDYNQPAASLHNIAITSDGGRTWTEPYGSPPAGFRSVVQYLPDAHMWIASGTSGSDVSSDGGRTWRTFDRGAFNAVSFFGRDAGWAVGPKGRIAVIHWTAQ